MGGVNKTFKKIKGRAKKYTDPGYAAKPWKHHEAIGASVKDAGELFTPDIPMPEKQPLIPIPDESLQENKARRSRARRSRTGRKSTILSGEGLGG